jgi:hypothetical protein
MAVIMESKPKYTFSGHDSFQCRQFWLKKGFDYVMKGKSFNDEDAVVELGVGKNMVNSIRFWMRAFDLISNGDIVTEFATRLFSDDGYDPYLEDEASLWLLHYQLIKKGYASTYSFIFNELRKEKIEFTKDNYISFIKRKAETEKLIPVNEKTLQEDFAVMAKMYLRSNPQIKDKEDSFSGLLTELDLIKLYNKGKEDFLFIENTERPEIPYEVILFSILDSCNFDTSISLNTIEYELNSVGSIFAINKPGIINKIEAIASKYSSVIFNDQAGIKELQFKKKLSAFAILDKYYAN